MNTQIPDWLAQCVAIHPDRPALITDSTRWTFADLARQVNGLVKLFHSHSVQRGNRMAVLLRNSPTFVTFVHAATRQGVVLVPLNTRLTPAELTWQVQDSGATVLVYDKVHAPVAEAIATQVPGILLIPAPNLAAMDEIMPDPTPSGTPPIDLDALHTIIYTSGTTGRPKGAMLTNGNHWWSAIGSALNLGLNENDRWLAVLPLFHVGGLSILFRSVIYGMPVVLQDGFDPADVNTAFDHEGVTIVSLVATMLRRVLEDRGTEPFPASLRCVLLGGGPAPQPLLEACAERNVPVVQTYGMTETASQIVTLSPADALRKLGSAGKPLRPATLRIETDGEVAVTGMVGEIVVRGPSVTSGYINRQNETAIQDGWLHTGDLGYLDNEGYLYVVDRRNDLIISGGENVYPAEIEAVLLAHPAVEEAGVHGVDDERWGQVARAVVKLRPNMPVPVSDLIAFCKLRLAAYKVPRQFIFVDELPRNAGGKLLRRNLSEL